jgi:hypothetical protein
MRSLKKIEFFALHPSHPLHPPYFLSIYLLFFDSTKQTTFQGSFSSIVDRESNGEQAMTQAKRRSRPPRQVTLVLSQGPDVVLRAKP